MIQLDTKYTSTPLDAKRYVTQELYAVALEPNRYVDLGINNIPSKHNLVDLRG